MKTLKDKATLRLDVRVSKADRDEIARLAKAHKTSLSEWLRTAALNYRPTKRRAQPKGL